MLCYVMLTMSHLLPDFNSEIALLTFWAFVVINSYRKYSSLFAIYGRQKTYRNEQTTDNRQTKYKILKNTYLCVCLCVRVCVCLAYI